MRTLITGAGGFVGQWLCREILERGWPVTGTMLGDVIPTSVLSLDERRGVRWMSVDVRKNEDIVRVLDESRPELIFHLAAVSFVPAAGADPGAALDINVGGVGRLMGELRKRLAAGTLDPVVLVVGSSEQYGRHDADEMPLSEQAEQRPMSVYAASKCAQEIVALEAWRTAGVRVVATRSFGHSGAGQPSNFLLPGLVQRALALRNAWRRELAIGNTSPIRDYLHVADVVRAYVALVERGEPGEVYNVASGEGVEVGVVAERVLALTGVDAKLQQDPTLVRAVDLPVLVGDASKLRAATGWSPTRTLNDILGDLIRAASR
ncbi:MAG TPA: GDP-mannose 4,6-dehydratase [Gemmatimonadaceae bacterium]|nr:GDP-mannose 4,6-dehydratase [Gemmatimonadaceae bacterium]